MLVCKELSCRSRESLHIISHFSPTMYVLLVMVGNHLSHKPLWALLLHGYHVELAENLGLVEILGMSEDALLNIEQTLDPDHVKYLSLP